MLEQLKNLCINILVLQSIKEVPTCHKFIKDMCIKNIGRNKRDPSTINVIGQLANLMLGKFINPKYLDLGRSIANIHIIRLLYQTLSYT